MENYCSIVVTFRVSLSAEQGKFRRHFLFEDHSPGTYEAEIKGGEMSIVRFDGDNGEYSLFLGKAKGIQGQFHPRNLCLERGG